MIDLRGKRGMVVGIANEHRIATGCAMAFASAGTVMPVDGGQHLHGLMAPLPPAPYPA